MAIRAEKSRSKPKNPATSSAFCIFGSEIVRGRTGSHLPELPFKTVHEFCSHTAPQLETNQFNQMNTSRIIIKLIEEGAKSQSFYALDVAANVVAPAVTAEVTAAAAPVVGAVTAEVTAAAAPVVGAVTAEVTAAAAPVVGAVTAEVIAAAAPVVTAAAPVVLPVLGAVALYKFLTD